jgi:hypothetical protein
MTLEIERQKTFLLCFSIEDLLKNTQQIGGSIVFHKKVTMKTFHMLKGSSELILNYTVTRKITLYQFGKVVGE